MSEQIVVQPQPGKQTLAFEKKVDFLIYGGARGSGKTEFITMKPLQYLEESKARFIYFRREHNEIVGANSLWEKAQNYYPLFGAKANKTSLTYTFPSQMTCTYSHMFHEDDKESHRGKGYSGIFFDELDHFSITQVQFLMTCLRSEAGFDSFCIGTVNPDPDSWVFPLVAWYLDDKGFPDPDKDGLVRYFIVLDGKFVFGDTEEYFKDNFPDSVFVTNPKTGEEIYIPPKTFSFISGNIFDNPALLKANPRYLSELQNLPDHERDRYLWGNWLARPQGENFWRREWIRGDNGEKVLDSLPDKSMTCARAYDQAGTPPSQVYRSPDFTAASMKTYKDSDGFYYLVGDYIPTFRDPDKINPDGIVGKFRKLAGDRDALIADQAKEDGSDCTVVLSEDPSSSGKTAYLITAKALAQHGLIVRKDPVPNTKSKLVKFQPFASACKNGLYKIVENTFDPSTLNAIYSELEAFTGERSTSSRKDDWADAQASCHNFICRETTIPEFSLGISSTPNESLAGLRNAVRLD